MKNFLRLTAILSLLATTAWARPNSPVHRPIEVLEKAKQHGDAPTQGDPIVTEEKPQPETPTVPAPKPPKSLSNCYGICF